MLNKPSVSTAWCTISSLVESQWSSLKSTSNSTIHLISALSSLLSVRDILRVLVRSLWEQVISGKRATSSTLQNYRTLHLYCNARTPQNTRGHCLPVQAGGSSMWYGTPGLSALVALRALPPQHFKIFFPFFPFGRCWEVLESARFGVWWESRCRDIFVWTWLEAYQIHSVANGCCRLAVLFRDMDFLPFCSVLEPFRFKQTITTYIIESTLYHSTAIDRSWSL